MIGRFILGLAIVSFMAGYAQAQNIVERTTDYLTPQCFENNCTCPQNYTLRELPAGGEPGAGHLACAYNGLGPEPLTQETRRLHDRPEDPALIQDEAWDPELGGYAEQGAVPKF